MLYCLSPLSSDLRASEGERSAERHEALARHVETLARRLYVPCDRTSRLSALHCSFDDSEDKHKNALNINEKQPPDGTNVPIMSLFAEGGVIRGQRVLLWSAASWARFADTGIGLRAGTRTQHHVPEIGL